MSRLKAGLLPLIIFILFLFFTTSAWGEGDSLRIIYTGNTLSNLVPSG